MLPSPSSQTLFIKGIALTSVLFLLGNVLYLDIQHLHTKPAQIILQKGDTLTTLPGKDQSSSQTSQYVTVANDSCPTSCSTLIQQATHSASEKISPVQAFKASILTPTPQVTLQPTPPASAPTTSVSQTSQVALGTGTSNAATWTNVPGVQAYINTSQYGTIKTVVFQASLNIPYAQQNVGVRLYNVTAQRPVWNSDVYLSSANSSGLLISQPLTLDPGNNLYQVQMQTQLQAPANLVQASVQITSN